MEARKFKSSYCAILCLFVHHDSCYLNRQAAWNRKKSKRVKKSQDHSHGRSSTINKVFTVIKTMPLEILLEWFCSAHKRHRENHNLKDDTRGVRKSRIARKSLAHLTELSINLLHIIEMSKDVIYIKVISLLSHIISKTSFLTKLCQKIALFHYDVTPK